MAKAEHAKYTRPLLIVDEDKCVGCNKCIVACPVKYANLAYLAPDGSNKVTLDHDRCIHCGACLEICDHDARSYTDDTERFFADLRKGTTISIVAAPAYRHNFSFFKRINGYLKSCGVNVIYDVSFGADITTWAYLKGIETYHLDSVIAQPCPAIVNYIERYQPALIDKLAPIHSPTTCTAVYLKKYKHVNNPIAFLSPCVGKADEFEDPNTHGIISYNVTYKKLQEYIDANRIDVSRFPESEFDDMGCGLGLTFSRPGGLRENVEFHAPGAFIRQVEGHDLAYPYLDKLKTRVEKGQKLPLLVDILNCEHGCNLGTGTKKEISIDDVDYEINRLKQEKLQEAARAIDVKSTHKLFDYFNQNLQLTDFVRKYTNKSSYINLKEPTFVEKEQIFQNLHKKTKESREINCFACGFEFCDKLVTAIHNDASHLENCMYYNQHELEQQRNVAETLKSMPPS